MIQEYWVSAGAEYNKENEVWVGQASFTAKQDSYVSILHYSNHHSDTIVK